LFVTSTKNVSLVVSVEQWESGGGRPCMYSLGQLRVDDARSPSADDYPELETKVQYIRQSPRE